MWARDEEQRMLSRYKVRYTQRIRDLIELDNERTQQMFGMERDDEMTRL